MNINEPIQNGIAQSYINDIIYKTQKETVKEVTEKVKCYLEDKLVGEFGDMAVDVKYLTINIDEFEEYIYELLKECEK